jgi:hypothetical protein
MHLLIHIFVPTSYSVLFAVISDSKSDNFSNELYWSSGINLYTWIYRVVHFSVPICLYLY